MVAGDGVENGDGDGGRGVGEGKKKKLKMKKMGVKGIKVEVGQGEAGE